MNNIDYECPKCENKSYETNQISTTGGLFSKIFDIQTKKFTAITCKKCKYTELYKTDVSGLSNIFDFLTQ